MRLLSLRKGRKSALATSSIILIYATLIIFVIIIIYPYLWMFTAPFKTSSQLWSPAVFRDLIPRPFLLKYYKELLSRGSPPILRTVINTSIMTAGATLLGVTVCMMAAYILARKRIYGKTAILVMFVLVLAIPVELLMIPLFLAVKKLGLLNTYWAVIFPLSLNPLIFFIFYQFFKEVPREIEDAALIDGAGELNVLWRIILPLAKPAITTGILLQFLMSWRAFIVPFLLARKEELLTMTVSLAFFSTDIFINFQAIMGVASLITIPVIMVFVITQKRVIKGITMGAIKG